jgi:large subunit ribosomal protein L10
LSVAIESKKLVVQAIKDKIKKSKSIILLDYMGLTVEEDTEFRREFRKNKIEYKVLKNTLVKRAFNELGLKDFDGVLNGPTALAFSYEDEIRAAKIVVEGGAKYKKTKVKCGLIDGKFIDEAGVESLSRLPSREALAAMALQMLQSPIVGLVSVCTNTIRGLLNVLNAKIAS